MQWVVDFRTSISRTCLANSVLDNMHDLAIAGATKSVSLPAIISATPGYCESATCGPDIEVAKTMEEKYIGKANFVLIEA